MRGLTHFRLLFLLLAPTLGQKAGTSCNPSQGHCTDYNSSDPGSQTYCCQAKGRPSTGVCCSMDQSCTVDPLDNNSPRCITPTCPVSMVFCPGNAMARNGTCYDPRKSRCCTGTLGGMDTRPIGELCPQNLRCCGGYGGWSAHVSCCDPFKTPAEGCYYSYGHTKCQNQSQGTPPLFPPPVTTSSTTGSTESTPPSPSPLPSLSPPAGRCSCDAQPAYPAYKSVCKSQTTTAACAKLHKTCTWSCGHHHGTCSAKPGFEPYQQFCATMHNKTACLAIDKTCRWLTQPLLRMQFATTLYSGMGGSSKVNATADGCVQAEANMKNRYLQWPVAIDTKNRRSRMKNPFDVYDPNANASTITRWDKGDWP